LRLAILSILNEISKINIQPSVNSEIIIVDDGAYAGFIINEFDQFSNYIKYVKNKSKIGANASRRKGLEYSSGEFVVFLDDDDSWLDGRFMELYSFHHLNGFDCHFARYKIFGSLKSNIIHHLSLLWRRKNLLYSNYLGGFSVFSIRRIILINNIHFMRMDLKSCQDWYLYINLYQNKSITKSYGIFPTIRYNVHNAGNISSSSDNRYKGLLIIKILLKKLHVNKNIYYNILSELFLLRRDTFKKNNYQKFFFILKFGSFPIKIKLFKSLFK
jgi:glycosyltransferase involved in cell wall biosynthesis